MNLLSYNSPLIRFFERVFELIVLNLLTLLLCVPLVTAGGAITALYAALFDMRRQKGRAIKGYLQTFKKEFKPALPLGLLCAAGLIAYGAYLYLLYPALSAEAGWAWVAVSALGALFFFPMTFLFPLYATFQNTVRVTVVNAFLMSVKHLFVTLLVLLMNFVPVVCVLIVPSWAAYIILVWLFIGVSLPAYLASWFFLRVFGKYAPLEPAAPSDAG
ncbi:MAG TPA: DUF624 domain-containing protein [Candidatus Cryosericum sp.]|nr:DUF624 domain-containing protein [Candidatus Cryosericum sp.]